MVNVAVATAHGAIGASDVKVKVILPIKSNGGVYVGFKSVALGKNSPPA